MSSSKKENLSHIKESIETKRKYLQQLSQFELEHNLTYSSENLSYSVKVPDAPDEAPSSEQEAPVES